MILHRGGGESEAGRRTPPSPETSEVVTLPGETDPDALPITVTREKLISILKQEVTTLVQQVHQITMI